MLIAQTRLGDDLAFQVLAHRHRAALMDLGRLLAHEPDPLADEALTLAHQSLRRGQGPHAWMRGYLLRLECRAQGRTTPTAAIGAGRVAAAFTDLAEAWQAALWHRTAERESAAQSATVVGVSRERVDGLVASAEAELYRSLLVRRWQEDLPPPCRAHARRLLATRFRSVPRVVTRHAARCDGCAQLLADLDNVEHQLPELVARHLLGDVAEEYLAVRRQAAADRLGGS